MKPSAASSKKISISGSTAENHTHTLPKCLKESLSNVRDVFEIISGPCKRLMYYN